MFNLININQLEQYLGSLAPDQWFIIDIPDVASPTGYTSYKVNPSILNQFDNFTQLLDTPNSYIGKGGKVVVVNQAESGLEFGDMALYDSGWKNTPVFNGSYGFAETGSPSYRPNIRVVGNVLYMIGLYIFPMPTVAGGGILDTNGLGYADQAKTFSDLFQGDEGFSIDGRNQFISRNPILPPALCPQEIVHKLTPDNYVSKTKNITGGRMRLTSFIGNFAMLPTGIILGTSIESVDRNGDLGVGWNRSLIARKNVDRFLTNDKLMNYDNYRNAFDNAGLDTLRVPNVEGYTLEYDFDGTRSNDLGGFLCYINTCYPLNPAYTLDQIKTAMDSL